MRVLIIPEFSIFGGTRSFLKRLIEIHAANSIETHLLLPQSNVEIIQDLISEDYHVNIHYISDREKTDYLSYSQLVYEVTAYRNAFNEIDPDIVFVSNGTPWLDLTVLLFKFPTIFFMHTYPYEIRNSFMKIFFRTLTRFFTSRKKKFATVSIFSAERIHKIMHVPNEYISVIYNSCRENIFCKKKVNNIETDCSVVFTAGHVESYKNPIIWLKVAQKVISNFDGQVKFIWAGEGKQIEEVRSLVQGIGLEDKIEFIGFVDDVDRFYKKSSLYFQPSRVESHGIAIVEAMAHGLPVVASNSGGIPESIVEGWSGFTSQHSDVDGFVRNILYLLRNIKIALQIGSNGRMRAMEMFNSATQEKKILELYRNVTSKN